MIAVFLRDLRLAIRAGGGIGQALAFFLIIVVLTPFAVGPDPAKLTLVAGGILWLAALLACLLSLDRIFALDYEDGTLEALVLAPLPVEGLVLAKSCAHWLTTGLPLCLVAPVLGVTLNLPPPAMLPMALALFVGTPALSFIGAFGAALALSVKRGGVLLSLLVMPLFIPTLILGADVVSRAQLGLGYETPLVLLAALTFGVIAIMPFATAAALRITLR